MQQLPDAPLGAMQIVGRGLELGAACFSRLFMATSLLAFASLLPTLDMAVRLGNTTLTPDYMLRNLFGWHLALVWVVTLCLIFLVQAFLITRLDRIARGGAVNFQTEWNESRRAFLPLVGVLLLCIAIAVGVSIMALILGAVAGGLAALFLGKASFVVVLVLAMLGTVVFIVIYLLFTQYLVVLEHKPPLAAINGSFSLVYGRWWHAFRILFVLFVLMIGIALLVVLPVAPLLSFSETARDGRAMLGQGVLEMAMTAVSGPFTLSVMYLTYHDLKLRSSLPAA